MAAYAALCSLTHIVEQIQCHPTPPISLDHKQVDCLTQKVRFLQRFLEGYSHVGGYSKEADPLESRIADAAHAAEDVIESHIVDQIHASHDFVSSKDSPNHASHDSFDFRPRFELIDLTRSTSSEQKSSSVNLCKCFQGPRKAANPGSEDVIKSHTVDQIGASHGFISRIDSQILTRSTSSEQKSSFFNFCNCFRCPRKAADPGDEDVIESNTVDQIDAGSTSHGINISSTDLYEGLQKVIQDMSSISKEVMEIKDKTGVRDQQQRMNSTPPADSSRPSSTRQNTMVGFDDALLEIMHKLTGGQSDLQVIPIVGMGGMGKTTLARNVYANLHIQQYFDVCAWATISQEYDTPQILREVLRQGSTEELSGIEELGVKLHKYLSGRRYLIVLDDMWSIKVWDEIRRFFPNYNDGSRIVVTTRLSNLSQLIGSYRLDMQFLDEDKSWNLLCKTVFGEKGCPRDLEDIGKTIATNCRGLPLSIVVTGGLLVKSEHSRMYWEYIAGNLNSLVNSEDNERCLKILYMSYKQLPVFLKPCFLYMGVFQEDRMIRPDELIRLWVAEGFLKPASGKSLEEVAEEYLVQLIDRNLVRASRHVGEIKECNIHDLLRDLCLREAEKERFYYVTKEHSLNDSKGINTQRRIVVSKRGFEKEVLDMPLARSLICKNTMVPLPLPFRLLRILNAFEKYSFPALFLLEKRFHFVNSRYLAIHVQEYSKFPSSISHLWNLQTLKVDYGMLFSNRDKIITAPSEIRKMPQLRHVEFVRGVQLPDPPTKDDYIIALTNLQSLSKIVHFKCSDEVRRRIRNLKKLGIHYEYFSATSDYFLNNLRHLQKLQSFRCVSHTRANNFVLNRLSFPSSLKKLTLQVLFFIWKDWMIEEIGSLPLLEVFKLKGGSFEHNVWGTVEGQFCRLKFLSVSSLDYLESWNSESTHFPCLEQLFLEDLRDLKEIPSGIGDIPTLESIHLTNCSDSAVVSVKDILDEQEQLGNEALHVRVFLPEGKKNEVLESLTSPKFQVGYL